MAKKLSGITIEINAETKGLDKALKDVNSKASQTATELREVEKLLKFNPKDTELLAQKQKLLGEQVSISRDKLDQLKNAEKQVQAQFEKGEIGEQQYREFQREVVETESKLKHYESQLKQVNTEKKRFSQSLQDVSGKLGALGKKMSSVGQSMTMGITAPIVGIGIASFKSAAEIEDAMGASDQIFKSSAGEVKKWADSIESFYGISEGEALSYANTMGAMLQNIGGLSAKEASKQSQMLVQLAGDLSAMFGGTTESAVQALTGALKGNNSMLDNYGMGVNEATIKQKAMEMGLIEEGEALSLASKQAATLALIMEQTGDAQGQAGREAKGASGSVKSMTTELKGLTAELGEVLLPIMIPFIEKIKGIVEKFKELSPQTKETIVNVALFAAAVGPVVLILGKVAGAISAIMSLGTLLAPIIAGISAPVVIAVAVFAALVAAGIAIYKNWDKIKEKLTQFKDFIFEKFNAIKEFFKKFKLKALEIPKPKLPKFKLEGEFSLSPPSVPKLSIEWNADGAIFTKPYIFGNQGVGEAGPEAVLPISKLAGIMADTLDKMGVVNNYGGDIVIEQMIVRDDNDIKMIANELNNLKRDVKGVNRNLGLAYGG